MENPFEIINKRLERIELLLAQLISTTTEKDIIKKSTFKNKMPTDEEMDAYLMKHVFSEKKK
ncbi:hypothetical protein [uncultured Maribacter sp.]|uniref:hypothetical protein n=1 Tax=uncultured Maribacter sp. TaxID=431308 RepID=UPI002602FA1E|nr:hypothetical protein [uncultured Maribacter sp.]